ncbi:GmrSD restriction endonuclease domain-containing protein [Modestobacter sp. VKM Ac-2984]|uniref:GmrSD restriction endonuclease domain-containing protein n=1 Tax=Modestobacter sp. VKM Ac-2984 TaxID=3004138 RepID=UPI0022AAE272|nr:DUF262 domain-containing protein [Modestobacter sp. VKM Ac-2984]MCZ2815635.1 DUF262 domain-containing protein [Modestobacter sp. VKM Ac-2984]
MAQLDASPRSIQSVYSWYSQGQLKVNRRYQRKLVWTTKEKQKLIESVMKRYPVPAILLAARDDGYEIIDGLQRLHAIVSFVETAFATLDEEYFDVSSFVTAKNRADSGAFEITGQDSKIGSMEVAAFLDYSLAITVMRDASESEIDDVFGRINTYGHRLSDQERRQAGVQSAFADTVRELATQLRQDVSPEPIVDLSLMPSISIDLPMARHGYGTAASSTFWVNQGVLRSTDLRDSMDEQCLSDIAAIIAGGAMIERSKDALDAVYAPDTPESNRVLTGLVTHGSDKLKTELKYCIDEIMAICSGGSAPSKLRDVIYPEGTNNSFPSVFAILVVALHEKLIAESKKIADHAAVKDSLTGLNGRLSSGRTADERRRNVNVVKGLIDAHVVEGSTSAIYGAHSSVDIDNIIQRSRIELPHYELKQGLLNLNPQRSVNSDLPGKVVRTLCAMANNGGNRSGTVLIGVTDDAADADRVRELDGVQPVPVGARYVVGVNREAAVLGETVEEYFSRWKNAIRSANISPTSLRDALLANIDYHEYRGLGVIVISVPIMREVSYVDDVPYRREGDETVAVTALSQAVDLGRRFQG